MVYEHGSFFSRAMRSIVHHLLISVCLDLCPEKGLRLVTTGNTNMLVMGFNKVVCARDLMSFHLAR